MQDNEGHSGYTIDGVFGVAQGSVPLYKPNLILINVGLNDCRLNVDPANAGVRMKAMIDWFVRSRPHNYHHSLYIGTQ